MLRKIFMDQGKSGFINVKSVALNEAVFLQYND